MFYSRDNPVIYSYWVERIVIFARFKSHMRLIVVFFFMFCFSIVKAQTYELGLFLGGSNIIGDVGSTQFIDPRDNVVGGIIKWNRSNRHSFRATLLSASMIGDDNDSDDISRDLRGLKYNYNLIEASIGIEYTFWEWELYTGKKHIAPYLYTGLTGFHYDLFALNDDRVLEKYGSTIEAAIPIVLGVKTNISTHFVLALEVGARYTFTDNLDGSDPERSKAGFSDLEFGNLSNNDWYVFSGATLTYTFGRKPCYCNF